MKQSIPSRPAQKHVYKKVTALDTGFIIILGVMAVTSCFAIYNTANLLSYGSPMNYLVKQAMWFGIGFLCLYLMRNFQNQAILKIIPKIYWGLMIALVYLLASMLLYRFLRVCLPLASPVNGAFSWFNIPLVGSFQPSEFIKMVLIIQTAALIARYQNRYPNPTVKNDFELFMSIAKIALPPLILIFMQPDTGLCLIIVFTLFVLLLCSGIRRQYVWISLGAIALIIGGFMYIYVFHQEFLTRFIAAYRLQRIEAWLHPDDYIRGSSNQLYTALLSLGSAGLTGHGMQASIISIPEAQTDFIFAAFGQCFGLLGTSFLMVLCLILDLYLCRMAIKTPNRMYKFIIIGVIAMLFYQQFQNLGMIVGLLPITGITLPLISYGGSSTLSYFLIFGFILNMPEEKRTTSKKVVDPKHTGMQHASTKTLAVSNKNRYGTE